MRPEERRGALSRRVVIEQSERMNGNGSYENGGGKMPKALRKGATQEEIVAAVNSVAFETQGCRMAIAHLGGTIEAYTTTTNNTVGLIESSLIARLDSIKAMLDKVLAGKRSKSRAQKKSKTRKAK